MSKSQLLTQEQIQDHLRRENLAKNGMKVADSELVNNYDGSFTLKPVNYGHRQVPKQSVPVPRVKLMVLAIHNAYPVNRSYI